MREQMPRIVEQLTGETWRGRLEHGPGKWATRNDYPDGWIVVKVYDRPEQNGYSGCGGHGTVGLSGDRGEIFIDLYADTYLGVHDPANPILCTPKIFAHEMGHVFGFWHVCGLKPGSCGTLPLDIGGTDTDPGDIEYSPALQYHAQLAYEVGRGRFYCGWPYGEGCAMVDPMARIRP